MKHKGGHHGGAWKVAYADFVTAMMALFLVLWLTAQDTKIKEAVERAFRNPFAAVNKESTGIIPKDKDASSTKSSDKGQFNSDSTTQMEMLRHITEDLAKMLSEDADQAVQVKMTADGLRINIFDRSKKPIFEPDKDAFTPFGAWVFSTLAWEISRYSEFHIELEGHTEKHDPATRETVGKWELSSERANAARRKLEDYGVKTAQIFKVSGFADTQPMAELPPDSESNRRVTVLLRFRDEQGALPPATESATHDHSTQ